MAQIKTFTWTNANPQVAENLNVGFEVAEINVVDETNGGMWYWNSEMASASYLTVSSGAITGTNGFTPLAQSVAIGATVSAFSNANPGVITVNDTATFGFAAGDTIKVTDIADDGSQTDSLNGTFTVASVTATTITLNEDTSSYSVYVSGGYAVRVSDTNGDPVSEQNYAIEGITVGTGPGAASAVMSAVVKGVNSVV